MGIVGDRGRVLGRVNWGLGDVGNGWWGRAPITTTHAVMGHGVIGTGGRQG